jgi:hypothetical protein
MPQDVKDLKVKTNVRAVCTTNQKIYGTAACEIKFEEDKIVLQGDTGVQAGTTEVASGNWFTNLISGIFRANPNDQDLTVRKNNEITTQSEKKYTCKSGTCVETSFGGVSLNECMSSCFTSTFSKLFEGISNSATTTKPITSIQIDTNQFLFPGVDRFATPTTTKPLSTFNLDNINFDFSGFKFADPKAKTNETSVSTPTFNFESIGGGFGTANTYQAAKYKCNKDTGKCVVANNLDKNTYLSESECNKNCYTVSSFNTTNSVNSFGNFNLQFNQ